MIISRLHQGVLRQKYLELGSLTPLHNRCTGNSLGKALKLIGKAMTTREPAMEVDDRPRELKELVEGTITQLGLKHLRVRTDYKTVIVNYDVVMSEEEIHAELVRV